MSTRHSLPIDLHTGDYLAKARALRNRASNHRLLPLVIAIVLVVVLATLLPGSAESAQGYAIPVTVEGGDAARVDLPVDVPVDLTLFLADLPGPLDPTTFQVVEVDSAGSVLDTAVPFQFDPDPAFDASAYAVGTLVFVLNDTTPPMSTREYRVLFDVVGGCGDCPAPPALPDSVTVDSLMYENQETFLVSTPRADYYYHRAGAGLASVIDGDSQDWVSFHDVPGSGSAGVYRGIPNLVFTLNNSAASFFHPGFTNASTTLLSAGPLKVSLRSVTNDPLNEWIVRWDFYPNFSRLTVEQTGNSNGGDYWYLYEGTPGGSLDVGDVVIRPDGTTTSAYDNEEWEAAIDDPQWVAFHDTAGDRYLFVNDDAGDFAPDSYRSQGQTSSSDPEMTVFGLGRVLNTSSNALLPRMSGAGRSFTMGLGESAADIAAEIAAVTRPVFLVVGDPVDNVSAVGDVASHPAVLRGNYPNPFNPATRIGFSLAQDGPVRLAVYDTAGRLVRTLVTSHLGAGEHAVAWDGRDTSGAQAASGVYLYRLEAGGAIRTGKMALVE